MNPGVRGPLSALVLPYSVSSIVLITQTLHKYMQRAFIYWNTFLMGHKFFRTQSLPGVYYNSFHMLS